MKTTLQESVLAHLKKGHKLTALSAFQLFGTMRLADAIFRLKEKGYKITTTLVAYKARYRTVNIAEYRLVK